MWIKVSPVCFPVYKSDLCLPKSMQITISISGLHRIPVLQRKMRYRFAGCIQADTHGTAGLCHQADPADAVLFRHGMENASHFHGDMLPVDFHYRQMFFRSTFRCIGCQDFKGLAAVRHGRIRHAGEGFQYYGMIFVS